MSNYYVNFGSMGENDTLESVFDIENAMIYLKKINDDIDHLKGLKKHRMQTIDSQIKKLENDSTKIREIILNTMKKFSPDKKTLNFPDIGRVSRKISKGKLEIVDEKAVIAFFDKEGKKEQVVKVKETIDVRNTKKLIDMYAKSGVEVPGVQQSPDNESVSISFDKNISIEEKIEEEAEQPASASSNMANSVSINSLDL